MGSHAVVLLSFTIDSYRFDLLCGQLFLRPCFRIAGMH